MKKTAFTRILSLLLALLMLAGCTQAKNATAERIEVETTEATEPQATVPEQAEMPREELDKALVDIDLSVLCAGFDINQRLEKLTDPYRVMQGQVVCTDYDQDGYRDVLLGRTKYLTFSLSPQRTVEYAFFQSPPTYYTDNEGNLYLYSGITDGFDIEMDGKSAWVDHMNCQYRQWVNGAWETVYDYKGTITFVDDQDGYAKEVENTVVATIDGKEVTKAELDAHFEAIGMDEISTQPSEYIQCEYDAIYQESLLAGLDAWFSQNYSTYTQMLRQDIDNDGVEEAIFILPDFENVWYDSLRSMDEYNSVEDAQYWFRSEFSDDHNHTGIVIADLQGDKIRFTAHCALQYISAYEGMSILIEDGRLLLDGTPVYLNGYFGTLDKGNMPAELIRYMADFGYTDHFFRMVDVTDLDGDEYMCICRKDGTWYIFIIVFVNGNPIIVYNRSLSETAVYLTEYQGQQCLMTYYQAMWQQGEGTVSQYNYEILRINASGEQRTLESAYCMYTDKDEDATSVSAFFQKLNVYLIKIIVIRDPYMLTGKQWMDQGDAEHGTVPQEDVQPSDPQQPEQETPVMGFVQIEDPASWLNLRVGPGVQYDKVLMDENDPNSFVRQALGSPVTVLETIETGDPENPVWLKIRITYADREIIGYSSKTYIRLAGE